MVPAAVSLPSLVFFHVQLLNRTDCSKGYHQFAGRDAARAYVTGCFKEHLTHDVRGFNEEEAKVRLPPNVVFQQLSFSPTPYFFSLYL